jgi:hypothetical protein
MAGFVTVLVCANLIGPAKTAVVLGVTFGAGTLFFPIGYVFGDLMTEVYGYAHARRVIWVGCAAMLMAMVMGQFVIHVPPDPGEPLNRELQPALELVFGNTWRVALASMIALWAGEFTNSYVMARMKVWTQGRQLWSRMIGSKLVCQLVDSALFYPIAFLGVWESSTLLRVLVFSWAFKVAVEVVLAPVVYLVIGWLKRAEHADCFDQHTRFTPFSLRS